MSDIEDGRGRTSVKSVGGYLKFLRSEKDTMAWLFREFTTPASRWHMARMLVLLVISTVFLIAQPSIVGLATGYIMAGDVTGAAYMVCLLIFTGMMYAILFCKEGREREWVLGLTLCRLDERITELLLLKPLGQHERHGSLLNYASIDKGKWKTVNMMDMLIYQGLPSLVMCTLTLTGLWYIAPAFGAFTALCAALFCLWALWLNYQVGVSMEPVERDFRRINRARVERWEKVQRVNTNGMTDREVRSLSEQMDRTMEEDRVFWLWFIGQFNLRGFLLQRMLAVVALAYGSYLVLDGQWAIGYLFPLIIWTDTFNNHLLQISHVERSIARDIVPVQLMVEALQMPPTFDICAGAPLHRNGPLEVSFDRVSYSYKDENERDHPVLRDISLAIRKGEKVALIGPSGAGKTTLMKLLLRFEDPTDGRVLINGEPLSTLDLSSFMQQVGYIPQSAMIFDSTIGENILYGLSPEHREELLRDDAAGLWQLMRSLQIDFGSRLDKGIHTVVGRHGLKLSGGQAQRVMIGAAVAKKPRLMVIDEATSNLDSSTEREVQEGLAAALSRETTALIIAHRLSTVRTLCDRFVVLRPIGELAEGESQVEAVASSMEELTVSSPTFRRLAQDQGVHMS